VPPAWSPIGLDATYSVGRHLSGVGVYSREILDGLAAGHPEQRFLHCYRPHRLWRGWLRSRPANVTCSPLFESSWPSRARLFHGLNQRMPAGRFRRAVCTFHDLFVMTGEYSTPAFRERFTIQAREAAQVEKLLGVEPSRIRVVQHGVRFSPSGEEVLREPWILAAGAVQTRKNSLRLVEAFERFIPPPWRLVLAGSEGYGAAAILDRIRKSPVRDRIEYKGYVNDQVLTDLYQRASIFAFPSLDEGFGIPVLEAMAAGLPVLSSNRSALPEVCGDAALLVDPLQVEEIGVSLKLLAEKESSRQALARRGLARAAEFTWSRAVEKTWGVYSEL